MFGSHCISSYLVILVIVSMILAYKSSNDDHAMKAGVIKNKN